MDCNYSPCPALRFSKRATLRCETTCRTYTTSPLNVIETHFASFSKMSQTMFVMHGQSHIEKLSFAAFFVFNLFRGNPGWSKQLSWRCISRREKVQSGPIIINILKFFTFLLSSLAQKRDTRRWPFSFSFVLGLSKIFPA